jgi:hypothetical protein
MVTGARCTSVCDVRCRVATKTIDDGHGVQESYREQHHQRPSRSPWTSSRCMIIIDLTVAAFSAVTSNPIKHQQHPAVTEPFWSRKKLKPSISAPGTGSQIVSWFIAYLRCAWWRVHPMPNNHPKGGAAPAPAGSSAIIVRFPNAAKPSGMLAPDGLAGFRLGEFKPGWYATALRSQNRAGKKPIDGFFVVMPARHCLSWVHISRGRPAQRSYCGVATVPVRRCSRRSWRPVRRVSRRSCRPVRRS